MTIEEVAACVIVTKHFLGRWHMTRKTREHRVTSLAALALAESASFVNTQKASAKQCRQQHLITNVSDVIICGEEV